MDFDDYQVAAAKFMAYPVLGHMAVYPTLGLAGESGEVTEKVKKVMRDKHGEFSMDDKLAIAKELGDVLWYLSAIATSLELDLDIIANMNIDKLKARQALGLIGGSGDDREHA